ncbi:MAG: PKD domain-containing protein, partial [Halieaceae bacterium]|nr:PKD domain-containing protein [Halieaceae bacterium]
TMASVTAAKDRLPDLLEMLANKAPSASFIATPHSGPAPLAVSFDASASADSDGEIVSFDWDFAGFAEASGMLAEHTFTEPGVHPVRLTVTDDLGGVHSTVFELNAEDGSGVAFTVPYVANGRYAEDLRPCIYNGVGGGCSLERLPFLGAEFSEPSVEDVMTRVLVSHRWMGDNFRAILERLPADLRLLARSVTAIVIASDIRPAYYWGETGAVYLDADFFWLTPQQQSVVTMEEDFRTDFGNQLQVELPWRYVRNNQRWSIGLTPDGYQRLEDLTQVTAYLLYHELAHAADFMPVSRIAALDPRKTAPEAIYEDQDKWHSSGLRQAYPLSSQVLENLGRVFFSGRQPTSSQIAIQPDDLIDEFSEDGAVDFYSYFSQFEDLADLLETLLMSYHQGLEKDTAITSMKTEDMPDRTVAWGQRGRMTDLAVIERLRWTIDAMYPGNTHDLHGYLTGRPAPLPMRRGDTWVNNIALEDGGDFSSGGSAITPPRAVYQPPMFPYSRKPATPSGLTVGAASQRQPISHIGGTVTPSGQPESEAGASSSPTLAGCIRITENSPPALLERLGLD